MFFISIDVEKLSKSEIKYIEIQIDILVRLKYNFIHYNPFPKVESSTIKEFILDQDEDDYIPPEYLDYSLF